MPPLSETVSSLYGALRLARLDAGGMAYFNGSVDGFWRSFFAAVLVLPLYVIDVAFDGPTAEGAETGLFRSVVVGGLTYVIFWVAFPVVMISLTRALGCWDRFIPYIVAYNWAAVWQNLLLVPVDLLASGGVLPGTLATFLPLVAIALVLVYVWFVARAGLGLPPLTCAGIVLLDLTLGILIMSVSTSLL